MSDVNDNAVSENSIILLSGALLLFIVIPLLILSGDLTGFSRTSAPAGQALYFYSKITATFVYVLMWWQIMMGILNKVNMKHHILLGLAVSALILTHVVLFISAVSLRQETLNMRILIPNFTSGYYDSGISLGIIALCLIIIATIAGIFRKKFQNTWKIGHGLVYLTFALATVHGLMIGSNMNTAVFSYLVYGAVFSLILAFIYKKTKVPEL